MNLPTLIVLLLVAAALVIAIRTWRRAGGARTCSCNTAGGPSGPAGKCAGCSAVEGCPFCKETKSTPPRYEE